MADKPFALIGVNSDDVLDVARESVKKNDINWRSFWNGEDGTMGPIAVKWSVFSWPTVYLIDAKGIIRHKNLRGAELDEAIMKLMAEAGHEVKIVDADAEKKEKKQETEKAKEKEKAKK